MEVVCAVTISPVALGKWVVRSYAAILCHSTVSVWCGKAGKDGGEMDAGRSLASGVARHGLAGMGTAAHRARDSGIRQDAGPHHSAVCAVSVYTADAPAATAYARTHLPGPRLSVSPGLSVQHIDTSASSPPRSLSLSLIHRSLHTSQSQRPPQHPSHRTQHFSQRRPALHPSTARSRDDPLIRPTRCPSPFALLPRTSTDSAPRHFHVFHFPPRLVGPAHNDLAYHPNRQRHCGHPQQGLDARPRN